ncbi:9856_t:CDS:2, partial [Acaulospora colombiana]
RSLMLEKDMLTVKATSSMREVKPSSPQVIAKLQVEPWPVFLDVYPGSNSHSTTICMNRQPKKSGLYYVIRTRLGMNACIRDPRQKAKLRQVALSTIQNNLDRRKSSTWRSSSLSFPHLPLLLLGSLSYLYSDHPASCAELGQPDLAVPVTQF